MDIQNKLEELKTLRDKLDTQISVLEDLTNKNIPVEIMQELFNEVKGAKLINVNTPRVISEEDQKMLDKLPGLKALQTFPEGKEINL